MEMEIGCLIEEVGKSLQKARYALNQNAYEVYMKCFQPVQYSEKFDENFSADSEPEEYEPIVKYFSMENVTGGKNLAIDLISLVSHDTLSLDNVKLVMKVHLTMENNALEASLNTPHHGTSASECTSPLHELTLEFKKSDIPPGIKRMTEASANFL